MFRTIVDAMIAMMGGKDKFVKHLDQLFTMNLPDSFFAETEDITRDGIIGGYIHGNEPSHHVAYLYDWTNEPWKTQERVRMILKNQYHASPDGLGGNDDCGQMSAWYLFYVARLLSGRSGFWTVYARQPGGKNGSLEIGKR